MPVYKQFLKNGRWKHVDPEIYSEIELRYLFSSLQGMLKLENSEDFENSDGVKIATKHSAKTLRTLETLLSQLNMGFYWVKMSVHFDNNDPTLHQLAKLIKRCIKLYMLIDGLMKVFKLIAQKEKLDKINKRANRMTDKKEGPATADHDVILCKRLQVAIKTLLKDYSMIPRNFVFKGRNLL